jgi:hypothetical protein
MLEWAGESISTSFSANKTNPFDFGNIEFATSYRSILPSTQILIVIDDFLESGYSRLRLKEICGDENNVIFFTTTTSKNGSLKERIIRGERTFQMEIPRVVPLEENEILEYTRDQSRKQKEDEMDEMLKEYLMNKGEESEEEQIDLMDKDAIKKMFWYEYQYDLWMDGGYDEYKMGETQILFPSQRKVALHDNYGMYINKNDYSSKTVSETEIKRDEVEYVEEVFIPEKIMNEMCDLNIKCKLMCADFDGMSDLRSIKTILSTLTPKKLVFIGERVEFSRFLTHFCAYNSNFSEVFYLTGNEPLNLSSELDVFKVKLSEDFSEKIVFKKIGNETVGAFKGVIKKKDGELLVEYVGPLEETVCLGNIRIGELRRMFVEDNLKVEINNNILIVEDKIRIIKEGSDLIIEGNESSLLFDVKNIIYKNLAFVN